MNTKRHISKAKEDSPDVSEQLGLFPLSVILVCGIIIIVVGIYLTITTKPAHGISLPDKTGQGGGRTITIIGPFAIGLGVAMGIFPAYFLIKRGIPKKKLKGN